MSNLVTSDVPSDPEDVEDIHSQMLSWSDNHEIYGWYCRGHVDKEAALQAALDHESVGRGQPWPLQDADYRYVRMVPIRDGEFKFAEAEEGEQGAFPVTVVERDFSEHLP